MRVFLALVMLVVTPLAVADDPIVFVTTAGVFRCDVQDGVPGTWSKVSGPADVIVRGVRDGGGGGGTGNPTPNPPLPPTDSPLVQRVAETSKATLKDSLEATAVAATINALVKAGVSDTDFMSTLKTSLNLVDAKIGASGRLDKWYTAVSTITSDSKVLIAGVQKAFDLEAATLAAISKSISGGEVVAEAVSFATLIETILRILQMLRDLGLID